MTKIAEVLQKSGKSVDEIIGEYGGKIEHLGRCELNTFVAEN